MFLIRLLRLFFFAAYIKIYSYKVSLRPFFPSKNRIRRLLGVKEGVGFGPPPYEWLFQATVNGLRFLCNLNDKTKRSVTIDTKLPESNLKEMPCY